MKLKSYKFLYNPLRSFKGKLEDIKKRLQPHKKAVLIISAITILILAPLAYLTFLAPEEIAAWSDSHSQWEKRKRLTLTNNSSDSLAANTTVAVTVNTKELYDAGKLRPDCNDLRVSHQPTENDATELTRHVVEENGETCATSEATKVHFNLQAAIGSGNTSNDYYMYYKNTGASAPSTTVDAFDIDTKNALLTCSFEGTTDCTNGSGTATANTATGAIRYSGSQTALSLDGINDYASVADTSSLSVTDHLTIEAWVKPMETGAEQTIIGKWDENSATDDRSYRLYINSSNRFVFSVSETGTSGTVTSITGTSTTVSADTWYHVSGVYDPDNTSLDLYVNGTTDASQVTSAPSAISDNGSSLYIGVKNNTSNALDTHFTGYIDEVRVSNTLRYTAAFTTSTAPHVDDEDTAALYHLDEAGDDPRGTTETLDATSNANDLTITGAEYVTGLIGVDNGTSDDGNVSGPDAFAGHEGTLIEEATTNKITNPSFEHGTFDTNWTASTAGADVTVAVTRVNASTSTGTQSITTTDLGGETPKAVILIASYATSDGTARAHQSISYGAATGSTNRWVTSGIYEDNASINVAAFRSDSLLVNLLIPTDNNIYARADFDSFTTNGVVVDWSHVDATNPPLVTAVFFAGDDVNASAGTISLNTSQDGEAHVNTLSFTPSMVFTAMQEINDGVNLATSFPMTLGVARDAGGGTEVQRGLAFSHIEAVSDGFMVATDSYSGARLLGNGNVDYFIDVEDFDSSGFSYFTREGSFSGTHDANYLAVDLGSSSTWVGTHNPPTSASEYSETGPGFTPQFAFLIDNFTESFGTSYSVSSNEAIVGTWGFSTITETSQYSNTWQSDVDGSVMQTQSLSDDVLVELPDHDFTAGITGTTPSDGTIFDSDGWDTDYTSVKANAKLFLGAAIEAGGTGAGAITDTENTTTRFVKFGSKSAQLVSSDGDGTYLTSINVGNTNTHTLSAYVYDGTSGNEGGTVDSTVAQLVFDGTAQTTTYTNVGGGWWRLTYSAAGVASAADYGIQVKDTKTVYLDGVQLEEKSAATTFADGSLGTGYSWSGTANDSTSSRTVADLDYAISSNIEAADGTFSVWIKPTWDGNDGVEHVIFDTDTSAGALKLYKTTGNNLTLEDGAGTPNTATVDISGWSAGEWHHVAATWDGTNFLDLYVDSSAGTGSGAYSAPTFGSNLYIGQDNTNGSLVNATLSDIRTFDDDLTSAEVTDLYHSGLVSHQQDIEVDRFSDNKGQEPIAIYHFDQSYGTTASDSSVYRNDLTVSGATWETQSVGAANMRVRNLHFDGTDDFLSRSSDRDFNFGTEGFTLEGWFRHPSSVSGTDTIIARHGSAGWKVYMNSSGNICFAIDDDSTFDPDDSACTTTTYTDSSWHHFAAVKDGTSSITLYIDGLQVVQDATIAATGSLSTNADFYVGIDSDGSSNPWDGFVDEIVIYPYARSADQVKADLFGSQIAVLLGADSNDFLTDGLVGYWKMDDNVSGDAQTITDHSGNGLDGTTSNNSTNLDCTVSGKFGYGCTLDGTDDNINVTDNSALRFDSATQDYSLFSWFTRASATTTDTVLTKLDGANDGWLLLIDSDTDVVECHLDDIEIVGSTAITDTEWHHVGCVIDRNGNGQIFVDGQPDGDPVAINSKAMGNTTDLKIGGGGNSFDGTLDETRIYNRALSPAEVRDLYNFAPGPTAYWPFEEGNGTTANDISGNGNTATLGGDGSGTDIPTWTTGKFGNGLEFDGDDDFLSGSISHTNRYTLSLWTKWDNGSGGTNDGLFQAQSGGTSTSITSTDKKIGAWIQVSDGVAWGRLTQSDGTGISLPTGATAPVVTADEWTHLSYVADGSDLKLYKDGVFYSSISYDGTVGSFDTAFIGRQGNESYLGVIDDVRFYNYARTESQIIEDMNAGHPAPGSPVGSSTATWRFDEGYGTTANDAINDNDLTLSSASWTNSGKFGKAWNGTGAIWLSRADDDDFDFTNTDDFAWSVWFKSDSASNPGAIEYIVNKASSTVQGYAVYANTSGQICFAIDDDTTWDPDVETCTSSDYYDATWHHVTAVRDTTADELRIYIDGVSQNSATDSTTATLANSLTLYLADRDGTDNGDEFNGDLDEVSLYRSTLTSDQVKVLFTQAKSTVFGATSTDSSGNATWSAANEYCPPGQGSSCTAPVGEWKFDENTGTTANDTSGNGNTGTLTNIEAADWVPGKKGSALQLDGSDEFIDIGTGPSTVRSIEFWVYPETTTEYFVNLTSTTDYIWANSGTITATGLSSPAIYVNGIETSTISAGQWSHVVVTTTTAENASNLDIGRTQDTNHLEGKIDNVRLYSNELTQAQVAWLHNRGGPVGWWRLDECSGTIANDASGNGNNGTITEPGSGSNVGIGSCGGSSGTMWADGATGKRNASLEFDGTDDYVDLSSHISDFSSHEGGSITGWFKTSSSNDQTILSFGESSSADRLVVHNNFQGATLRLLVRDASSNLVDMRTETPMPDGSWHHFAVTMDSTNNATIYVNGKLAPITTGVDSNNWFDAVASADYMSIGRENGTAGNKYFTGQIDDVRIYNYALTEQQIQAVMGEGAVRFGPAEGSP